VAASAASATFRFSSDFGGFSPAAEVSAASASSSGAQRSGQHGFGLVNLLLNQKIILS
jgi:hypothetical protein